MSNKTAKGFKELFRQAAKWRADHSTRWKGGEVRFNEDGSIDEIVLPSATVHLEQMHDSSWWMGLTVNGETMHVNIYSPTGRKVNVNCETDCGKIRRGFKTQPQTEK